MANISKITLPSGNTYDIKDSSSCAFGTCTTAAGTAAKVVTISDNNWSLRVGSIIAVKFSNSNSASNVTLNVNDTGAKSIWYNQGVYTGNSSVVCGVANRHNFYIYDGTYWVWIHCGIVTDTDTKNTAGATDTSSKIFLIGATSQSTNPQTYSDNQVYTTDGQLDANKVRIGEHVTLQYEDTSKCLSFVFS